MASTTSRRSDPHKAIRELYQIGRKSLESHPPKDGMFTRDERRRQCRKYGLTDHRLGLARKLAWPDQGYTRKDLEALLAGDRRRPFLGIRHLELLLRVAPGPRRKIAQDLVRDRWGVVRLTQRVQGRTEHPRKPGGGRPPAKPHTVEEALFAVRAVSRRWLRLFDLVSQIGEDQNTGRAFGSDKRWRRLGPHLAAADRALSRLVQGLESET